MMWWWQSRRQRSAATPGHTLYTKLKKNLKKVAMPPRVKLTSLPTPLFENNYTSFPDKLDVKKFWGALVWNIYTFQIQGVNLSFPFKVESRKLAGLKCCRKSRCQERGLGCGLGGALGWGQLQLVGSEVANRCPSQPSSAWLLLFCQSAHFKNCQVSLKLWHATWEPTATQKQNRKIDFWKTIFKRRNAFLVRLDGFPTQATNEHFMSGCAAWRRGTARKQKAAWLTVLPHSRD